MALWPLARYRTRSTSGRSGFTSWVTKSTAMVRDRQSRQISAMISCSRPMSRLASGSSRRSSLGSLRSAWAIRRRCLSPPESSPRDACARARPSTSSRTRSMRRSRSRFGHPGPHRWPSRPKRTTSRARRVVSASMARNWGTYPIRRLARPGACPRTCRLPEAGRTMPRRSLSRVLLPAPLGPRMAMNSPSVTSKVRSPRMVRSPRITRACDAEMTVSITGHSRARPSVGLPARASRSDTSGPRAWSP